MEIKYTIEILTKDIQDIENLVRNLNNYPSPPRIEIDLAMAKLRNVYELLAMISSDLSDDLEQAKKDHLVENDVQEETIQKEGEHTMGESRGAVQEENREGTPERRKVVEENREGTPERRKVVEESREEAPEKRDVVEESREGAPEKRKVVEESREEAPEKRDVVEESREGAPVQKKEFIEKRMEEAAGNGHREPLPEKFREEVKRASIIAEKFAANKSINEKIAPGKTTNFSSKLTGEPIDSIKRNIGINDRFLIIRELLNGDNEGYNQLVQQLDASAGFDQAFGLLEKRFPDKMDHEGVDLLVRLSRRRFLLKDV